MPANSGSSNFVISGSVEVGEILSLLETNSDPDGSGTLSVDEFKVWEGGDFHVEDVVRKLFQIADNDKDMHVSADELVHARQALAASDAQYDLMEWVEHHEL